MTKIKNNLATLLENDLEQAKLVIAAQDVLDRLQKIAEHLAELGAEEIMPLSDNMKAAFGPDIARDFEQTADEAIQKALETVRGARDVIDVAILKVQGQMPQSDMGTFDDTQSSAPADNDMASQQVASDAAQQEQDSDQGGSILDGGDGFDGADGAASAEPMGRARKESVENRKSLVEKAYRKFGNKLIVNETVGSLVNWLLEDAAAKLSSDDFKNFKDKVDVKVISDPVGLAGMIGFKKASVAGLAQAAKPIVSPSAEEMGIKIESKWTADERKARGMAKVIEANIMAYGHGKAASVLRQFTSTDLRENSEKTLIETFKNIFGVTPAAYSVSLRNKMIEDIVPTANPTATDDTDTDMASDPTSNNIKADPSLTTMQKSNAAKGVAKLASDIGANAANGQKPLAAAMSDLSGPEKQAVDDVVDNINSQTGEEPDKVGELLKTASDVIGENISSVKNCSSELLERIINYNKKIGNLAFVEQVNNFLGK